MKIATCNVITYIDGTINSVTSFKDTKKGSKEAEELFETIISQDFPDTSKEDIEICKDNGVFESEQGDVQIFITHSE